MYNSYLTAFFILVLGTRNLYLRSVFLYLHNVRVLQDGNRGKSKKSKRKEKVTSSARVTMHLDEFVGRDEEVYEDEFGVLHRQPVGTTDPR